VIMLVLIKYLFSLEFGGERKRGLQISRLALCISNFGSRERLDCAVLRTSLLLDKEQSFWSLLYLFSSSHARQSLLLPFFQEQLFKI
jgi:hypothetical protein